jgi:Fe-S cluster assembly ATP-binding protein
MLVLENLHVSVGDRQVLKDINLTIQDGETAILFGPNGSGKTTLLMTIMGMPDYILTKGRIIFKGQDITTQSSYKRARLGIGISFQRPPTIHGLKTRQLIQLCARQRDINIDTLADKVNFRQFLDRDINDGFSGGEIKRSELLQLMAQQPQLLLFDEPESGVDLDNMALIASSIQSLLHKQNYKLERDVTNKNAGKTASLIITHTGYILNYIQADTGYILFDGQLQCRENPIRMLEHIRTQGYRGCISCLQGELNP